jgi:hypothetical protein
MYEGDPEFRAAVDDLLPSLPELTTTGAVAPELAARLTALMGVPPGAGGGDGDGDGGAQQAEASAAAGGAPGGGDGGAQQQRG